MGTKSVTDHTGFGSGAREVGCEFETSRELSAERGRAEPAQESTEVAAPACNSF